MKATTELYIGLSVVLVISIIGVVLAIQKPDCKCGDFSGIADNSNEIYFLQQEFDAFGNRVDRAYDFYWELRHDLNGNIATPDTDRLKRDIQNLEEEMDVIFDCLETETNYDDFKECIE